MTRIRPALLLLGLSASAATAAAQGPTCYSGICFPQGDVSFADTLLDQDPTYSGLCGPTMPASSQGFICLGGAIGRYSAAPRIQSQ